MTRREAFRLVSAAIAAVAVPVAIRLECETFWRGQEICFTITSNDGGCWIGSLGAVEIESFETDPSKNLTANVRLNVDERDLNEAIFLIRERYGLEQPLESPRTNRTVRTMDYSTDPRRDAQGQFVRIHRGVS